MASLGSTRIAHVWQSLSDESRRRLTAFIRETDVDDERRLEVLGDTTDIQRRASSLSEEQRELLDDVMFESGLLFEPGEDGLDEDLQALQEAGLIVPVELDELIIGWFAPLEVRLALLADEDLGEADLTVLLAHWDEEDLHSLAALCEVEAFETMELLDLAEACAEAMMESSRLEEIIASLHTPSRGLLLWLFQHDGPIAESVMHEWLTDQEARNDDALAGSDRVLRRFGLIQSVELQGSSLVTIASDLRAALLPLLSTTFDVEAQQSFQRLRDAAIPAYRDAFPRGAGGNPIALGRYRLLRALQKGMSDHPVDQLLVEFFALDPQQQTTNELASFHLDVSTADAFARHILRIWWGSVDDRCTRALFASFGGDLSAVANFLNQERGERGDVGFDYQMWLDVLTQFRGVLLIALGVLPAGMWFPLDTLRPLVVEIYRRTIWQYGRFELLSTDFPWEALPAGTEEITAEMYEQLGIALSFLFRELLEPIGAATLDHSGQLFLINPEAFRSLRDRDPGFDGIWEASVAIFGDDAELWLPLPVDPGLRRDGVAPFVWDDEALVVPVDTHISDLERLAVWGEVSYCGDVFRFHFDDSFDESDDPDEVEEFLVWLVVRTGAELPATFRMRAPLTTCRADDDVATVRQSARAWVARGYEALEAWAEAPSLRLVEELRSWGSSAGEFLHEELKLLADAQPGDPDPRLRHIVVLLGELQYLPALNDLFELFRRNHEEHFEGAVAMALARFGTPALPPLLRLLHSPDGSLDKLLAVCGTLSSLGVLHPLHCDTIFQEVRRVLRDDELPEDVSTIMGSQLAEMGHNDTETLLRELRDQGRWLDAMLSFDDALWMASIAPTIWGHPHWALPLAQVFPNRWETDEVVRIAGISDLLTDEGGEQDAMLGERRRWRRRNNES